MVRAALPLAFLILLTGLTAGLSLTVDLTEVTDHRLRDIQYSEEISTVQNINTSIENIGSIGCTYRLKAEFQEGNETIERFSSPEPLWQGANTRAEILYIPMNYTGMIDTNLSITYCGQEKPVENFSFNVTEKTLPQQEMDSRTVEASERSAKVELEEGELLVPEEEPSYWKTSTSEIINGTATVEYDAPIFDSSETITYSVVEDNEVIGRTEVQLEAEPTLMEELKNRKAEILGMLLGLSVLFNVLLYLRHRGLLDKEKLPDYELPSLKREE